MSQKQTLETCFWFNTEADTAAELYCSLFPNSRILGRVEYGEAAAKASGQKRGETMTVEFELAGLPFLGLNGGPHFKINPSISLFVTCDSESEIDRLWKNLKKTSRMDLKTYPFAKKYGWCEDRFGVHWQMMLGDARQKIAPALLFANKNYGKAEDAIHFYTSTFANSKIVHIARDEKTKAVVHSRIQIADCDFIIMEGPLEPEFSFSPAISFVRACANQSELDGLWSKLSAVPEAEQCGWLCDRYGVSWQLVPTDFGKRIREAKLETRERLMTEVLSMKKLDLDRLNRALLA
jgi:predicted 3-demethylubiquinone-9 3-methyltransferase (glyoxalase superfamily)